MESEVLAERILLDLENAFKKDPFIDEFDILPISESVLNKCPVILAAHKLAIESWCVRHVYLYVYTRFIKWRQHPYKIDPTVLLSWTTALLLLNPDLETALNCRKELVQTSKHFAKDELKFCELVLCRKPKNPQLFAHRKWMLAHLLKGSTSFCTIKEVIEHELRLCTLTADKYSNNYYVWNHRMWIVQHLLHFCSKVISEELQVTEQWVSTHISDHSGFHYRQFLFKSKFASQNPEVTASDVETCLLHRGESDYRCYALQSNSSQKKDLLLKELQFLSELQFTYPGHEALWNHRRFIIYEAIQFSNCAKLLSHCPSSEKPSPIGNKKYKLESDSYLTAEGVLAREQEFLHESAKREKNNFWEQKLITRHEAWLKHIASSNPVCLPHM